MVPFKDPKLSIKQNNERSKRIIFVGNIPTTATKKELIKNFSKYGKLKKIWLRSVPVDNTVKLPKKAKILKNKVTSCPCKNCYILFEEVASVKKAINGADNVLF